ncbi:MAG: hypothetical protein IPK19_28345 [Chloroflexi bacterium]|nr:hypothetical protein [Chloroflexota bacterium]
MTFETERILPELVCWQLNAARWVKDWFFRHSQEGCNGGDSVYHTAESQTSSPPIEEQHQILGRYLQCSRRIETEEEHISKLRQQKHGLMHDLLTGHVRVPEHPDLGVKPS